MDKNYDLSARIKRKIKAKAKQSFYNAYKAIKYEFPQVVVEAATQTQEQTTDQSEPAPAVDEGD